MLFFHTRFLPFPAKTPIRFHRCIWHAGPLSIAARLGWYAHEDTDMWLHYEDPCSRSTAQASVYPPTVAYCCFQPRDNAPLADLAQLAIDMLAVLHPDWSATFLGLRPYAGDHTYACQPQFAPDLICQHPGEGYALVPCLDSAEMLAELERMPHSEESSLVHLHARRLVCFLHDGHDSLEIVGAPAEIRAATRFLFDRYIKS